MLRKIIKMGNSLFISLPNEMIEFLQMREGSEIRVDLDREKDQIVITPSDSPMIAAGIDTTFARQVSEFTEQYRQALEELAK
jgi:putative addiction module antidote